MTRALVSEKWQPWQASIAYDDTEVIGTFLSLFQGAHRDLGQGQAGALVYVACASGGADNTTLKIYPAAQITPSILTRDTEAQKTITLATAANITLYRTFWVPWEDVGDGFYLGFKNAAAANGMVFTTYHKRLWTP